MTKELEYSATLTGASFLLYEFKKVTSLYLNGLSENEIKEKVIEKNLFDYKYPSSIKRALPSVMRRVKVIDYQLAEMILHESIETAKTINLYTIMKTDKLFFEFMDEVIKDKLQLSDFLLEKKDLNMFFESKAEQDTKVSGWTEKTLIKLKQVYIKLLFESGILTDKKSGTIKRLLIDEDLRNHLRHIGDIAYLKAMGDDEGY
ncbi:hypothetical protein CAI16_17205 [Virgibacillus dokdonensis]|uniref:Inner membrane protein n=2 Tax=Virgibacillus dokdonensis TaxID=302167 RepID=A0A3E0WKR9_9BACI|nr:hypothetical protein CAI16_17205 [Virgibacillus dokdonensis]